MAEIGKPVREWQIEERPVPNVNPDKIPQREKEAPSTPEREKEKVGV